MVCKLFEAARRLPEVRDPLMSAETGKTKHMFAVIKTGGKQFKVVKDELIDVEKLDAEVGKTIKIAEVLMVGEGADVKVGNPMVEGAEVTAEVVDQRRDRKVLVFKKKRRQNYRRKAGHRQHKTVLKITGIKA